jgi:hypothetical protein
MKPPPEDLRRLLALGLLGVLSFAGGLALAFHRLPEWRSAPVPPPSRFIERFHEQSGRLSFQPADRQPLHLTLATQIVDLDLTCDARRPGAPATAETYSVCIEARQEGLFPGDDRARELALYFSPQGLPRAAAWIGNHILFNTAIANPVAPHERVEAFTRLLMAPGETLGPPRNALVYRSAATLYDLRGSAPAEHVLILSLAGGSLVAMRGHGTAAEGLARQTTLKWGPFVEGITRNLFALGVCILFLVLVGKRRVDMVNGGVLAAIVLATLAPELFTHAPTPANLVVQGVSILIKVLWIFLVWSAGESLIRSYRPLFTTSLDSLRAGRIGPRGGRALLFGLSLGAMMAGIHLAFLSLAIDVPAIWPERASLTLPLASLGPNPFGRSIALAGTVVFLLAAFVRVLPVRWAAVAASLATVLCWYVPVQLSDFRVELGVQFFLTAVLVWALRTFGLTALLVASVSFCLLPAAVYSSLNLAWMPWVFAGSAGLMAAFLLLGLIGLGRPASVEAHRLQPPRFIRRIEEERRLRYEMQLLARMQVGLLPQSVPELPGWEIAARSILATEAGGDLYDFLFDDDGKLWVAVGDVAGHGYSCAIVQAMTTAALTSLIRPGLLPSEVLLQVDRVIRRGGSSRNFATLALLRLDPATGEVVLANAGHPFPLLIADGDVAEIVLPGLPLGKGPPRCYLDLTLHLAPGAALVFCSDGLIETQDFQEAPYGFDRPREVLRHIQNAPAESLLEVLLADWRRHLGSEEPPDDTTIVVVRRVG